MAEATAEATASVSPLGKHLADLGITVAAIVDDAYDIPTRESLNQGEVDSFWGAIERNDQLIGALHTLAANAITGPADIKNDAIKNLWEAKGDGSELARHAREQLFATVAERRIDLDSLEENLRALGLDVKHIGSTGDLPDPKIKLVFL